MTRLVLFLRCNLDQHPYWHLVHPSCTSDQQKKNIICNILCFQGMVVTGAYKVTTVNTEHVHILCRCVTSPSICKERDTHTSVCHEQRGGRKKWREKSHQFQRHHNSMCIKFHNSSVCMTRKIQLRFVRLEVPRAVTMKITIF